MSNTVNVFTAASFEFPFNAVWESEGLGFSQNDGNNHIVNVGSVDTQNVYGNQLQVAGIVIGSGYYTSVPSPAVIISFEGALAQTAITQAVFTKDGGSSITLPTSNAFFQPPLPSSGIPVANITTWAWSITTASDFFHACTTTQIDFTLPIPPINAMTLGVTGSAAYNIGLAWTDTSNAAVSYNLSRDSNVVAHLANNVFRFIDTGLTPNTTYHYSITGVDGSNNNIYTPALANGTTMSITPVSFLSAFNGEQFYTANGQLNIGGNVHTYSEGSLTPIVTYTDVTGSVPNPNPIQINTDGFLNTAIWAQAGMNTRVRVMDSSNSLLQDIDNIPGVPYVPGSTAVYVIDSIFSTDTANAASANAANWIYKIANGAYAQGNTNANAISNVIANVAGLSTNTIVIQSHGVTINVGNSINFINTAFANIAVTPFGPDAVSVAVFANGTTSGSTTANSSVTINGIIFQWAYYTHTAGGEAGPFSDSFPAAFPTACLGIQLTTQGGPGAAGLVVSSLTRSSFTWYTQFAGASSTGQYVFAYGY